MKKSHKLPLLTLAAPVAMAIPAISFSQNQTAVKPNIIYIYLDDMGYGEPGCYGQEKIQTPNIDKLAAEGMRFTQHYSGAPVSAPSRCMLMTGKHAGHSYIRGNYELGGFEDSTEAGQMPLPDGIFTIPKMMKQAGYVTGAIGKWGLGMSNNTGSPNQQGFDYFYGYLCQKQAHNFYPSHLWENGQWDTLHNGYIKVHQKISHNATDEEFKKFIGNEYSVEKMAEKTMVFIKQNKNKPFFLYLPYTGPHVSLQAPESAVAQYLGKFEETPYYGDRGYVPCKNPRATYAAMISYTDSIIGQIMNLLKTLDLDKNTIVMFSSDNGATFPMAGGADVNFFKSVGDFRGYKMDLYEGGIRIPFIARWTGKIPAGKTSELVSAQFDLMATLADLTHVKTPQTDGISFLPTLLGKPQQQKQHSYLYFEYPEKGGQVAIRMGSWKGVKSDITKNKQAEWEIYNLTIDPKEQNNIASQYPDLVRQFENILQKEHQPTHLRDWEFINPKFE